MKTKKQKAATQRAWRILRMKGVLAFLREMDVPEVVQQAVESRLQIQIEFLYRKELT